VTTGDSSTDNQTPTTKKALVIASENLLAVKVNQMVLKILTCKFLQQRKTNNKKNN
jgi:hypothetical protein